MVVVFVVVTSVWWCFSCCGIHVVSVYLLFWFGCCCGCVDVAVAETMACVNYHSE